MPRYKEGTEKKICILKNKARKLIEAGNIEYSMQLTSCIGQIEYALNQQFIDQDIEKLIQGFVTCLDYTIDTYTVDTDHRESKSIAFYDGFGLDLRGLAYIYLKGLISEGYRIKYITEDRHWKRLENIAELLRENNSEIYLLQQTGMKERALAIYEQIYDSDVSKAILYTSPVDVSAIVAFNKLENVIERFRINLTDHAFWIGVKCTDYCIEFRNYGASISCIYRGLEKERLLIQPFYPAVISGQEFGGFPSVREDNDFWIFSGGALYKTGSRDNLYYDTVRKMLDSDERVKFWYAGYGESHEMDRLLKDYQGRAFYTSERKDLFQLMRKCDLYFSTYPIAGGLMTQYACKAGIIPLTLKSGNHEDELIFNQEEKNIDFLDQDKLLLEFKKILFDRKYKKEKEKLLNDSVIQEERFNTNLHAILEDHVSGYKTSICQIDVNKLQNIFSINNGKKTIENAVATLSNRNLIRVIPFFYTSCLLSRLGKWGGYQIKRRIDDICRNL